MCLDAVVGGSLGKVQHLRAVGEHRGAALAKVEAPAVDLHQRAQQRRGRMPFFRCEALRGVEQRPVVEAS